MQTDAIAPVFLDWRTLEPPHPGSAVWIRGARHPLLPAGEVVPTDFLVEPDLFTVLITGPNTGGKTVALKNVALIAAMAQSGLHVTANEARLTVFEQIFADIGDEQSIEQSLSTFSAHITNIIRVLDGVNARSLVVFDELGSGTDPTEGAAIAQAIINFLRDKGATSFIATHYPELKVYATQTEGATNASMLFDVESLSPTYELAIGIPGKSNALSIARRLGLEESILDEAMELVGVGSRDAENMIASIHDLREKISAEEAATRAALTRAESERDQLLVDAAGIEYERRRILDEARKQAEGELEAVRAQIRKARKQIKDAQSQTALKRLNTKMADVEAKTAHALLVEDDAVAAPSLRRRKKRLQVGDSALIKTLNTRGTIMGIQGSSADVAVGRMTMKVALNNLEFRERPEPEPEPQSKKGAKAPITSSVNLELDIRGQRVEEGLEKVAMYLDRAALAEMPYVRIIHGKGTGRLRQAIRRSLKDHYAVRTYESGKDGEGGDGVTVVKFKEE